MHSSPPCKESMQRFLYGSDSFYMLHFYPIHLFLFCFGFLHFIFIFLFHFYTSLFSYLYIIHNSSLYIYIYIYIYISYLFFRISFPFSCFLFLYKKFPLFRPFNRIRRMKVDWIVYFHTLTFFLFSFLLIGIIVQTAGYY